MKPGAWILSVGLALIVLAAVFHVVLPVLGYAIWSPGLPYGQDILVVMEIGLRFVAEIVPAIGAALTAAGIVLLYLPAASESSTPKTKIPEGQ
jgi:hypothetical protein